MPSVRDTKNLRSGNHMFEVRCLRFDVIGVLTPWQWVTAFFAIGMFLVLVTIAAFVLVESWLHHRRLRRMQRETMEAHQRETEITRRPHFLP
jgi:membrane protein implicated in regulation of membrane protease activity